MTKQIAVDIGGTFTDVVISDDETGQVLVAKGPTVPKSPDTGVLRLLDNDVSPGEVAGADYFLHGTTVGLNALLEREGVSVGLVATEGFRDILEVRRGDRGDPYDLFWAPPPALVPRRLRIPVRGRILTDGSVLTPLEVGDVDLAFETFQKEGVVSVAVALINAYANPEHEQLVVERLQQLGFRGPISTSHTLSREYREYERTSTCVIDAYVRPRVGEYLQRLETGLEERGFHGEALVTRCGGGALTFLEAAARPVETVISGPVAGVVGAALLAQAHGFARAISADVGGTSFDTCLILDGRPDVKYEGVIEGMPVQTEWVDVRSIGAGGGSIAFIDAGGLLRVGPHSAGADPGPACYGRGGLEATATDAAMALGLMGTGELAGKLRLSADLAWKALTRVADQGSISEEQAARGILEVNTAAMAGAIREITVERGEDPRAAAIIAFGGAGPVFATLLARDLDISTILIPVHAGNFSACGLLASDLVQTASQTRILRVRDGVIDTVQATVDELHYHLVDRSARAGLGHYTVAVDMRFVGQEHTLTVAVASNEGRITVSADQIGNDFLQQYNETFGLVLADTEVEIVTMRVTLTVPRGGSLPSLTPSVAAGDGATSPSIRAWSFEDDRWMEFASVHRESLRAGDTVAGPAVIAESTATTYMDVGYSAHVCDDYVLEVTRDGKQ
jgi:N-methylhydantoinase A